MRNMPSIRYMPEIVDIDNLYISQPDNGEQAEITEHGSFRSCGHGLSSEGGDHMGDSHVGLHAV